MTGGWRPQGYPSLSPYLICSGATELLRFLEAAFGAEPLRRFEAPDGSVLHAEARIGDSVVMLGEAGGAWPAVPSHLHLYVEDVDAAYRRALDAGGIGVQEPSEREGDPDRRGGVKDPGGNTWWLGTQK
jgi:PhnB protein